MTVLYPNLCYNKACYKRIALNIRFFNHLRKAVTFRNVKPFSPNIDLIQFALKINLTMINDKIFK